MLIFGNKNLRAERWEKGVVQGGLLYPALFNYYQAEFPTPPPIIKLNKYVDDNIIYSSRLVAAGLINGLNI